MHSSSRRDFLRRAAMLAAGAATLNGSINGAAPDSGPHLDFPKAARDRLAVASWPFRAFIEAPGNKWARDSKLPGMDLKNFGAMVVERFGLHNIEPLSFHFRSTDPAYLREFLAATEKAAVRVVNLPVDSPTSLFDPDPVKRAKAVDATVDWIGIAAAVGSPSIRRNLAEVGKLKPEVPRTVESLKRVADHASEKKIVVNLENDNNFTEDPLFLVEVIEKVNSPYLHALPDFCNSRLTHDDQFNDRALAAMFKHAYNIAHVKDSEPNGEGKFVTVDVGGCFDIAKAAGYRGYFSMEWEGDGEPYAGTQKLIHLSLPHLV